MKKRRYSKRVKTPPIHLEKKAILSILGIALLAFSLLLLLSLFTNTGLLLSLREKFFTTFGIGIIFIPFLATLIAFPLLSLKFSFVKPTIFAGSIGSLLAFIGLMGAFSENLSGSIGISLWSTLASPLTPIGAFFVLFFAHQNS